MIERPRTHTLEVAEETANTYLGNLGLEWSRLTGKKVLDIGALDAAFENAARRRGVDVISVDKDVIEGEHAPPKDSNYVIANATKLPFGDEAFDYAIAHTSTMNYIEKEYDIDTEYGAYVEDALREASRVLKAGGQFRFTSTLLDAKDLREGDEAVPEKKSEAHDEWLTEREHRYLEPIAKRAGFKELQVVRYVGEQRVRAMEDYCMTHYFVAVK